MLLLGFDFKGALHNISYCKKAHVQFVFIYYKSCAAIMLVIDLNVRGCGFKSPWNQNWTYLLC